MGRKSRSQQEKGTQEQQSEERSSEQQTGEQESQEEQQATKPGTEDQDEAREQSGAEEVDERLREVQEQGFFGEKIDPYDNDEYTATGNQGRQAHEDRAKAVNPEGHGRAVPGRIV